MVSELGTKAFSGMGREGAAFIEPLGPRITTDALIEGRSALSPSKVVWTASAAAELKALASQSDLVGCGANE